MAWMSRRVSLFSFCCTAGLAVRLDQPNNTCEEALPFVKTLDEGDAGTKSYRRFFVDAGGKEMSPWHDIPLRLDDKGEYFMVTEIPKFTKPKMEIATKEKWNPIAQDIKKGELREYHGPIFWNYGYVPQTWEDPNVEHTKLHVKGDNDPLDVVEIGSRQHVRGEISRIKVLGALAMIDSGELDWKLITIDTQDVLAEKLNDIADVDRVMPHTISGIREWFRWYKFPDGKPLNEFGLDEVPLGHAEALKVIQETHEAWQRLRDGKVESDLWSGFSDSETSDKE
eukprot:TRINITY_DN3993_c0_g3_i2.p1 TRINITY_DN3993_c0_g3~~TRINITY_DN3993_c0_g3_i2.p1  ORF type:complete len:282 (-),score=57.93 TRINITY_DN3993_c0_g3_i2:113-958(-)